MRSTGTRPRPREIRALAPWAISRAPVAAAMRWAFSSASVRTASPPSTISVGRPRRRMSAALRTCAGSECGFGGTGSASATTPPSSHEVSDGRISVAICPGWVRAACTATAASAPTVADVVAVRTQAEAPRAQPSVSAVSGASFGRW